jgi:F-type H+-transporting ATPase subunit a
VKQFSKVILLCAFFAATFIVPANAQISSALPTGASLTNVVESAHAEASEPLVSQTAQAVFYIGQPPERDHGVPSILTNVWPKQIAVPVTNSMICTWIVAALIILIVRLTTWKMKEVPSGGQNVMEALIEGWEGLMGNVIEPKVVKWVFPFAMSFFIFIVISNLTDLLPGVGSIGMGPADKNSSLPFAIEHVTRPFFRPPTTDANLTVAMAGIFFVMGLYWALKYNGPIGLVKHVFGVKVDTTKWLYPLLLLLFIFIGVMETFSILFIRPVALALRLYGNIFGGETMLTMALSQKPWYLAVLVAVPGYFFEVVVCLLQAFVFTMLVVAFVGTLCSHADEEHGH